MQNNSNVTLKDVNINGVVFEIIGSCIIVLEHVLAMFLISKCRIVQSSVKILVTNLCIIDIIAGFWGCIRGTLRLPLTDDRTLCMLDVLVTTCVFNVSAFLVSAIAIDRYVSVFLPMKYTLSVDNRLFRIVCSVLWIFGAILSVVTLFSEYIYTNERGCEIRLSQKEVFPWILVLLRFLCLSTMAFTYSCIYKKIRSLKKQYKNQITQGDIQSIGKMMLIVLPHLLLHIFFVLMFFLKPVFNVHKSLVYESYLSTAVTFVDSWIYVFRFKECRINLAIYLYFWKKDTRDEYIKKRKLMYGTYLEQEISDPTYKTSNSIAHI